MTEDTEQEPVNEESQGPPLRRAKIMIAEDVTPMRVLIRKQMEQLGATVEEVADGRPAMGLLRKAHSIGCPFTLLLLDLMMPRVSGLELLAQIRADPDLRDLPVVVVSASSERDTVVACGKYGVAGYVVKPYTMQTLMDAVLRVASHSSTTEASQDYPAGE